MPATFDDNSSATGDVDTLPTDGVARSEPDRGDPALAAGSGDSEGDHAVDVNAALGDEPPRGLGLRSLGGLILLAGPVVAGSLGRSILTGVIFLVVFVAAKIVTGWPLWRQVLAERGREVLPAMVAATVAVQGVFVTVLFLAGRAIGAVLGYGKPTDVVEGFDWTLAGLVLSGAILFGTWGRRKS